MSALSPLLERLSGFVKTPQGRVTVAAVLGSGGALALYLQSRRGPPQTPHERADHKKKKVAVDKEFVRRLRDLLSIVIPSWRSKEFLLLALHTGFLVARTFVSIYVASLDGSLVKSIVDLDVRQFMMRLMKWLIIAVPATYINSMIRFLESKLSIAFRSRLVDHLYSQYMRNEAYYRVDNVDSRMKNPDQCLTEDVARFSQELAHIYSQVSKPIFDIILMTGQLYFLARERSGSGLQIHYPWMIAAAIVYFTGFVLRRVTPPFGKMVAEEGRRYGHLRAVHARLITHSEEIAFYGGHKVEESTLRKAYAELISQMNLIYKARIPFTMLEQFLMKYVWGAGGLLMIAIPAFMRDKDKQVATQVPGHSTDDLQPQLGEVDTVSTRTQDFIVSRSLLVSAADAMERLMSSWKEIAELAGHTFRVHEMIKVFRDVQEGRYVKAVGEEASALLQGKGEVVADSDSIESQAVPVVTPNGDVLVRELNFRIDPGMHLLITGPNGCGKSSLFRIIGGLWPVYGGRLLKPRKGDMFYIPQRPYLCSGTLRDQLIYPDTVEDMRAKGKTDADLQPILRVVKLENVVAREGGLDKVAEWRDVLSGGEKQRVAFARVFYHRPKYAILDECTSAVSIDVEGQMYLHAKELGITLMTITHRPTLWQYHSHLLQFDGEGGYKFSELNASTRLSLEEEKTKLEKSLADFPRMQERLQELCTLLGEDSQFIKPSLSSSRLSAMVHGHGPHHNRRARGDEASSPK